MDRQQRQRWTGSNGNDGPGSNDTESYLRAELTRREAELT